MLATIRAEQSESPCLQAHQKDAKYILLRRNEYWDADGIRPLKQCFWVLTQRLENNFPLFLLDESALKAIFEKNPAIAAAAHRGWFHHCLGIAAVCGFNFQL